MTCEDSCADILSRPRSAGTGEPYRYENVPVPAAVDWREKDIVGPIKDQVREHRLPERRLLDLGKS